MSEVRENLAWVDYASRRQLTPSVAAQTYCYQPQLEYTNRLRQSCDRLVCRFRIVGPTDEEAQDVAAQYMIWGRDLLRITDVQAQTRRR